MCSLGGMWQQMPLSVIIRVEAHPREYSRQGCAKSDLCKTSDAQMPASAPMHYMLPPTNALSV